MLGVDVYYVDLLIFVVTHPDANAERQIIIIIIIISYTGIHYYGRTVQTSN